MRRMQLQVRSTLMRLRTKFFKRKTLTRSSKFFENLHPYRMDPTLRFVDSGCFFTKRSPTPNCTMLELQITKERKRYVNNYTKMFSGVLF